MTGEMGRESRVTKILSHKRSTGKRNGGKYNKTELEGKERTRRRRKNSKKKKELVLLLHLLVNEKVYMFRMFTLPDSSPTIFSILRQTFLELAEDGLFLVVCY